MLRNAHFKNLPMSDAVKITFFERLINDATAIYFDDLMQDVMQMTTRDWLLLSLLPLKIFLLPVATYVEQGEVRRLAGQDCSLGFTTYSHFVLYWRRFDDFKTKPYRWNEI